MTRRSPTKLDVSTDPTRLYFDTQWLEHRIGNTSLVTWIDALAHSLHMSRARLRHGDLPRWRAAFDRLPPFHPTSRHLNRAVVATLADLCPADSRALGESLYSLLPWRKGPYRLADWFLDTEWRSDFKWSRLIHHVSPLSGRRILDVGCGNGYHLWRMRGAGASEILGIDPGVLSYLQFSAVQHCMNDASVTLLPLSLEALPASMQHFHTVFSMGVLYHRRSPGEHLGALYEALMPGGELVVETLVIPEITNTELKIKGRYAGMRNVWTLPTPARLKKQLIISGFNNVRIVSIDITSTAEQRRTAWSSARSLADALDPACPALTVEGYLRPHRAIAIASKMG